MKGSIVKIAFIESLITYLVALTTLLPLIVLICTRTYLTRIFTRSNLLSTHSNRIIGCLLVVSLCPLAVLAVLPAGLFITDHENARTNRKRN